MAAAAAAAAAARGRSPVRPMAAPFTSSEIQAAVGHGRRGQDRFCDFFSAARDIDALYDEPSSSFVAASREHVFGAGDARYSQRSAAAIAGKSFNPRLPSASATHQGAPRRKRAAGVGRSQKGRRKSAEVAVGEGNAMVLEASAMAEPGAVLKGWVAMQQSGVKGWALSRSNSITGQETVLPGVRYDAEPW